MDCWRRRSEHSGERRQVIGVAGQDIVTQPNGCDHEVGIDHIGGSGLSEEASDRSTVVQRVNQDRLEERCQTGLPRAMSPHLRHDWVGCMQRSAASRRGGKERVSGSFAPVDGDQEASVENHRSKRAAMPAISSSSTGPCSRSHSATNERRARWRRRSSARPRRACRMALDRPPNSGARESRIASSSSSSRTVVVPTHPIVALPCYNWVCPTVER